MNFPLIFKFARRFWINKKEGFAVFIIFFAIIGVFLGTTSLIVISSVMNGLERSQSSKLLGSISHITMTSKQQITDIQIKQIQDDLPNQLSGVVNINKALNQSVLIKSEAGIKGKMIQGIDSVNFDNEFIKKNIKFCAIEDLYKEPYSLIIGYSLAVSLDVSIGDYVSVTSSNDFIYSLFGVFPVERKFKIIGFYGSRSSGDKNILFADINHLNQISGEFKQNRRSLGLTLSDPYLIDDVISKINQLYPDRFSFTSWRDMYGFQLEAVQMEKVIMFVMLSLIILVAVFNIVSSLFLLVNDKQKDIAVLKTLGFSNHAIMFVFITQSLISGCLGLFFGVICGLWGAHNLPDLLISYDLININLSVYVDYMQILYIIIFTVLIVILGAIYPAIKAARIYPAEVLRYE